MSEIDVAVSAERERLKREILKVIDQTPVTFEREQDGRQKPVKPWWFQKEVRKRIEKVFDDDLQR